MANTAGRKISQGMKFAKATPKKAGNGKTQPRRARPQRASNANPRKGHR